MSISVSPETKELETRLGYSFSDPSLLVTAITHSSYANEKQGRISNNERLEFLGDSVLSLVISDHFYHLFNQLDEGNLTKVRASIVSEISLAEIARNLELGDCLLLGKGEERTGGRKRSSILADSLEAIIGAVYEDGGFTEAQGFVLRWFKPSIDKSLSGKGFKDYKTDLQEILQKDCDEEVLYKVVKEEGPDHDKTFFVEVYYQDKRLGRGMGKSKKVAEQQAAQDALEQINI